MSATPIRACLGPRSRTHGEAGFESWATVFPGPQHQARQPGRYDQSARRSHHRDICRKAAELMESPGLTEKPRKPIDLLCGLNGIEIILADWVIDDIFQGYRYAARP